MAARVDELCDAAKTVIEAAAVANPLAGTTVTVTCDDIPDIDADDLPAGIIYVLIWFESYSDGGPDTRGEDIRDYRLCFLIVQRYGEAGEPTTAWRRERTAWVDTCVVESLSDPRVRLDTTAYALSLDEVAYDQEELLERKLFWTKVSITVRDHEDA